jgi:flagella basal body P-ring formation protein FlgA
MNRIKPNVVRLRIARLMLAMLCGGPAAFCLAQSAQTPDVAPDEVLASASALPVPEAGAEKFVPTLKSIGCSGTLELLKNAEISGRQIRVRQVARWSEADSASFSSIADLVIDNFDGASNRKLSLDELRETLNGAGVNLGLVHFAGATQCLLSHVDEPQPMTPTDDRGPVQQWIDQKNHQPAVATPATQSGVSAADTGQAGVDPDSQYHSLRDLLLIDVSQRLNLPTDQLQVNFNPKDRSLLNLSEPEFRFSLEARRVRDLGRVSWDVTVISGEKQQVMEVDADARAWQKQLVMEKAANYRQIIREGDISERRILVDHVADDQLLTRDQVIGQQAARDLKPGTVLTARLVDPVPLARNGQYITVTLNQGALQVRAVGKAMESGAFGQTIKVKNEQTQDVYDVTLTGPQQGSMGGE